MATPLGSLRTTNAASIRSRNRGRVISGAADPAARRAPWPRSSEHLVRRPMAWCCCFTPPFDHTAQIPVTSKDTSREFAKTAGSTLMRRCGRMAFAALGDGDKAANVPHAQSDQSSRSRAGVQRYKVEPYVVAGDVYAEAAACRVAADGRGTRARRVGFIAPAWNGYLDSASAGRR